LNYNINKIYYKIIALIVPLMAALDIVAILRHINYILIIIISVALFILSVINLIVFFIPYALINKVAPEDKHKYRQYTATNMLNYSIITKMISLPLIGLVIFLELAVFTSLFTGWGLIWIGFTAIITLLFNVPISMMIVYNVMFLFIMSCFFNSLMTSFHGINAIIILMRNKQLRISSGLICILLMLIPVTDITICILLRKDVNTGDKIFIKKKVLISLSFLFIAMMTLIGLVVMASHYFE